MYNLIMAKSDIKRKMMVDVPFILFHQVGRKACFTGKSALTVFTRMLFMIHKKFLKQFYSILSSL